MSCCLNYSFFHSTDICWAAVMFRAFWNCINSCLHTTLFYLLCIYVLVSKDKYIKPGVKVHTINSSTLEAVAGLCEFKASLACMVELTNCLWFDITSLDCEKKQAMWIWGGYSSQRNNKIKIPSVVSLEMQRGWYVFSSDRYFSCCGKKKQTN